jgi:iron complex outermembrane receptor protein
MDGRSSRFPRRVARGARRPARAAALGASLVLAAPAAQAAELWDLSLAELGKIRITSIATGTRTPVDKAPAVASVITADDILAMGATDLDQVLESVPGLHVTRSDQAYTPRYVIRGISSPYNPQTLVLVNGIPLTSLFVGNRGNVWGGMPVRAIARIEIIRGPGSALYGADAFAGVINIVTKSRQELEGTQVIARTGSFETRALSLEHGARVAGVDVGLVVEAESTDGWRETVGRDRQSLFDQFYGTSASLAPGPANTGKRMLEARLDLARGESRLRAGYQGRYDLGTGPGIFEALDPRGRAGSERFNADFSWSRAELTPDWGLDARVSYYRGSQETRDVLLLPPGAAVPDAGNVLHVFPQGLSGNPGFREDNVRLDVSGRYDGAAGHVVRLGAGAYRGDMFKVTETKNFYADLSPRPGLEDVSDSAETYLPERDRRSVYVFAQDEWKLAPAWQLTSGLRYDHYSDFGDTANPRLALVWAPDNRYSTRLLYGRAFRAPALAELFTASNPVALGNAQLAPETLDSYELAFTHNVSATLLYTANVFHYRINDLITFVPTGLGTLQAQNAGRRRGSGVELEADYSPRDSLRLLLNLSWQRAEDADTGRTVGEAPEQELYVRSEWQLQPGWRLDSQLTWNGEQERAVGDARAPVAATAVVDLTLRRTDVIAGLDLAAAVRNLLDEDVREPSPGPGPAFPFAAIPGDLPMPGRSLYGEVTYRF